MVHLIRFIISQLVYVFNRDDIEVKLFKILFYQHLIQPQNHDAPAKAAVKSSNLAEYVSSSIFIRSNLSCWKFMRLKSKCVQNSEFLEEQKFSAPDFNKRHHSFTRLLNTSVARIPEKLPQKTYIQVKFSSPAHSSGFRRIRNISEAAHKLWKNLWNAFDTCWVRRTVHGCSRSPRRRWCISVLHCRQTWRD